MKKVRKKKKKKVDQGETFEVVMMDIDTLKPAPYNPRVMDEDGKRALRHSIKRWGMLENVIWNKRTGHLVGGHQRLTVLREEGYKQVGVRVVDISEEEEKELNITLNNQFVGGQWEAHRLAKLQDEIQRSNPASYDMLMMFKLKGDVLEGAGNGNDYDAVEEAGSNKHPEMEIMPYEHHDYILVVFDDYRNFQVAIQKLGLEMVNHSMTGQKKIGLGRCIKGERLLALLDK